MEFVWHRSMAEVDQAEWNALAETSSTALMSHEWLNHLEQSGSITEAHGWSPRHLTVHHGGTMIAAVPLYLRDQSWGEFVFDFAFAEVAGQIGSRYYPKMVGMSPASPSPAFGFLVPPGREDELTAPILSAIEARCRAEEIGVLQFNFVEPPWKERLESHGLVAWEHHGYEWYNEGFRSFDDYLARFRKNQRRNIRRERSSMEDQGIDLAVIRATQAPDHYFTRMADFYRRTNDQFGPYAARFLTREFFTQMPETVARHSLFVAARTADEDPVALALLVHKDRRVLGRYWGSARDLPNLHFNVCYYTPIEWAIQTGVSVFDPGMGSEHKVRRGFRSVPTYSLHRFFDPSMHQILQANMERINSYERAHIRMLDQAVPYKAP